MIEKPLVLPIAKIKKESPRVKSFFFKHKLNAQPGQFIMMWMPGFGERPVAVFEDKKGFSVSVAKVGSATSALHKMKVGDKIGFRGPFGTNFTLPKKKGEIVLIGGGYGMVPLSWLAFEAKKKGCKPVVLNGARSKEEILYKNFFKKNKIKMLVSTDDGSLGKKGFVHELFLEYLERNKNPVKVFVCGPELMEYAVSKICWSKNIPFEVSVERYMKCGMGVCGSCCVDKTGWRMCVEGPVLSGEKLKKVVEFGKYHRSASGKIEYFGKK